MHGRLMLVVLAAALLVAPAAAQSWNQDQVDDSGDVLRADVNQQGQSASGSMEPVDGHEDVDITMTSSRLDNDLLLLTMEVAGTIRQEGGGSMSSGNSAEVHGFVYQFSLDVRGDDREDYRVNFDKGGAELEWTDGRDHREESLESERAGNRLIVKVPLDSLEVVQHFGYTAAAVEIESRFQSGSFQSTHFIDVVGDFPDYAGASGSAERDGTGLNVEFTPPIGTGLVATGLLLAVASARRR